jgi:hypothetical protein
LNASCGVSGGDRQDGVVDQMSAGQRDRGRDRVTAEQRPGLGHRAVRQDEQQEGGGAHRGHQRQRGTWMRQALEQHAKDQHGERCRQGIDQLFPQRQRVDVRLDTGKHREPEMECGCERQKRCGKNTSKAGERQTLIDAARLSAGQRSWLSLLPRRL